MRNALSILFGWLPLAAALVSAGKLAVDVARPAPAAVDLLASCLPAQGACSLVLPERRAAVAALRLALEGPAGRWEVCARGRCFQAEPLRRFDWLELPAWHAAPGEPVLL